MTFAADDDDFELPLSAAHRDRLFRESGISPAVAKARGYQTVTRDSHGASYKENGWGSLVARLPALEIPLWTTDGRAAWPQIRPDQPRMRGDKVIKYEMPAGESLRIDVNPMLASRVKGTEPLVITEGILKADAAISKGMCCIGLLGVWGFRGRNLYGGITSLADWQNINLRDRDIYIAFDSDIIAKSQVQQALSALRTFLSGKGAKVFTVYLPEGPEHSKVGLDDYLLEHSAEDFWKLAQADPDPSTLPLTDAQAATFDVRAGSICSVRMTEEGRIATPLCNFEAHVESVNTRDDGMTAAREFRIAGMNNRGAVLPVIGVPAEDYDAMNWVTEQWAGRAVVQPGRSSKDALRVGIMTLSTLESDLPETLVYTHVGWRLIDDEWYYLSTTGGLGSGGMRTDITVAPDGPMCNVALTNPERGDLLNTAIRESLAVMNISANDVVAPVLAATYLSPLSEVMHPNFIVHIVGHTGSMKTETAALMQGHFGRGYNAQSMPGSWLSTANYMERQAFVSKDCVLVMDDFRPGEGMGSTTMHQKAESFIRGIGNSAGRGRLNSDSSAKKTYHSRGLVISTGEDIPQGESLRARMAIIEMVRRDVNLERLTKAQADRDAGMFVDAMSGYIRWLAPRLNDLRVSLHKRHLDVLKEYNSDVRSLRTPFVCAYLYVAFELFCLYATEEGAITQEECDDYLKRAKYAILHSLPLQSAAIAEENEVHRFLEVIKSGLLSGRCHLRGMVSLGWEDGLEAFGWEAVDGGDRRARGRMIGYVDFVNRSVLLIPHEAYSFAHEASRSDGRGIALSPTRLWKNMSESGMLETHEMGHLQIRRTVPSGDRARLMLLSKKAITVRPKHSDQEIEEEYDDNLEATDNGLET